MFAATAERYKGVPNLPRSRSLRIRAGFVENSAELAFCLAIGSGLVWLIGIGLSIADPDPNVFGPREVDFLELAERYKQLVSPPHVIAILVLTLLVSIALNSLWPMLVAARLRQCAVRVSIVLAGMTMFSFVGIGEAADRREAAVNEIKAAIVSDVEKLIRGRQKNAAYHWLAASLQEHARAAPSLAELHHDLAVGRKACNDATMTYDDAYKAAYPFHRPPRPICDETTFTAAFARDEIERPDEQARRGARADWAPEFRGAVTVTPGSVSVLLPPALAAAPNANPVITGLQALHHRTSAAREEEESARKAMRESVTTLVASLFPELGSTLVGIVLDAWKETAIGIVANESADRIAERLRQNRYRRPSPWRRCSALMGRSRCRPPVGPGLS